MSEINRLPIIAEANMLSRKIWKNLPHTVDKIEIKRQFSGLLSAHIDTYEIDKNKDEDDQVTRYREFIVRAGKEFYVSSEDIRKIRAYVNYEIDDLDAILPNNSEDKVYILYGLINIIMINGLPAQKDLNIPEIEFKICNHFAKILGFKDDVVMEMIKGRISMENELAI
jgi:hypothetical protein